MIMENIGRDVGLRGVLISDSKLNPISKDIGISNFRDIPAFKALAHFGTIMKLRSFSRSRKFLTSDMIRNLYSITYCQRKHIKICIKRIVLRVSDVP